MPATAEKKAKKEPKDVEVQAQVTEVLTEVPLVKPADLPLTQEEKEQAERRWTEKIQQFAESEKKAWTDMITGYWERGSFLDELTKQPRIYGNHTVEQFAEALQISVSTAYMFQRYYQRTSLEEAKRHAAAKLPWRAITQTLSIENREEREGLQQKLLNHEISPEELPQAVKSLNKAVKEKAAKAGKKVDNRGGAASGTVFRATTSLCVDLCERLDEFKEAYKTFSKMDEDKKKAELSARVRETFKALQTTQSRVDAILRLKEG